MFLDKYGTTETVRSKEGNLMVSEGIGYNKGLNWNLKWKQNMREWWWIVKELKKNKLDISVSWDSTSCEVLAKIRKLEGKK